MKYFSAKDDKVYNIKPDWARKLFVIFPFVPLTFVLSIMLEIIIIVTGVLYAFKVWFDEDFKQALLFIKYDVIWQAFDFVKTMVTSTIYTWQGKPW